MTEAGADASREGEGVGSGTYVDAGHSQQSRPAVREPKQDEKVLGVDHPSTRVIARNLTTLQISS